MADYVTDQTPRVAETPAHQTHDDAGGGETDEPGTRSSALQRLLQRRIRDDRGRYRSRLVARGELQVLPRRVSRRLRLPPFIELYDVRFLRFHKDYLWQAGLAVLAILGVLLLVDSVADAAIAAGLGSSAVIVFVHPTSRSASLRNLIGGHVLGLLVGTLAAFLLFQSGWLPVAADLSHWAADIIAAIVLGVVIVVMGATDTEHPPAAATALGFALQSPALQLTILFVGAVLVLAVAKLALRNRLQDLID